MDSKCLHLFSEFCRRYSIALPEPDARDHYQLGFDQVEISLFEDLGNLYVLAELAPVPDKPDERMRLIEKSCSYLFGFLYLDECMLNLYNVEGKDYLVMVMVMVNPGPDSLDDFDNRLAALVNRTEALSAHLAESAKPASNQGRSFIFRP